MEEQERLNVRKGSSSLSDASQAAIKLAACIRQPDMVIAIFFVGMPSCAAQLIFEGNLKRAWQ